MLRLMVVSALRALGLVLVLSVTACGGDPGPAPAPASGPTTEQRTTFHLFAAWTRDQTGTLDAEIGQCPEQAGGVSGGSWLDSAPPPVVLHDDGDRADALDACLRSVGAEPTVARSPEREPGPAAGPSDVARASFLPGPGPGYEALATGALRGDPVSGCLWVERSGPSDRVVAQTPVLVFDDAAYVDFAAAPPVVRTALGHLLVRLGETASLAGGYADIGDLGLEPVPGCPVTGTSVFLASSFPR